MKNLFIISGCTGVGKTNLSINIAKLINAEILSCDSMLFYKELNIGNAKPTHQQQSMIKHHGLNLITLNNTYNINQYQNLALETIKNIHTRKKNVLIVGGSCFYLNCFFNSINDGIKISSFINDYVDNIEKKKG